MSATRHVIGGGTRWTIATWYADRAQWQAPMTASARRLTGCHTVVARTEAGILGSANVQLYRTEDGARRALRREIVEEADMPCRELERHGFRVSAAAVLAEAAERRRIDAQIRAEQDREARTITDEMRADAAHWAEVES